MAERFTGFRVAAEYRLPSKLRWFRLVHGPQLMAEFVGHHWLSADFAIPSPETMNGTVANNHSDAISLRRMFFRCLASHEMLPYRAFFDMVEGREQ